MNKKSIIVIFIIALIITIGAFGILTLNKLFIKPLVSIPNASTQVFYFPSNSDFDDVRSILVESGIITNIKAFDLMSKIKSYKKSVKSGKYIIKNNMTANELVSFLRSGAQTPSKVTFNNIRFLPNFVGKVSPKFEFDSTQLITLLSNKEFINKLGYNKQNIISLFLPNTYNIWWNSSPEDFVYRMKKEHDRFWNKERKAKASKMNLTPIEVNILASIVQEETNNKAEMSRIAGVYYNRLKIGMLLQADPTARFAYGDFSVRRVNYDYLKIDSPYNTYKYKGLPPGPICMANPITIDKVLNYENHKYYYFCAKPDNSGKHVFARNLRQHNNNANAYHRYLNKQRIYR